MILFPAIDLKDGQCVRLRQGEMDRATVFNDDPGAQARSFQDAGFRYLHIVDLNGAFEGKPVKRRRGRGDFGGDNDPSPARRRIRDLETDRDVALKRASPG